MTTPPSQRTHLRLAVAQPLCFPGDVAGNLDRMQPLIAQAAGEGARLILFGEAGVTGLEATPRTWNSAVKFGDITCQRLHRMAKRYDIVIAAGFLERRGKKIHNTHGVFFPDGELVLQRKAGVFPVEKTIPNYAAAPPGFEVFEVDGVRCAITICGDSGLPRRWNQLAAAGVQVHLIPTAGCGPRAWGFHESELDDPKRFAEYLKKAESVVFSKDAIIHCRRHRMAMASCNQMADNGVDYFHPGHSMIVDSTGELAALIPGSFVFEHLRPRVACGEVHPAPPRIRGDHE